MSDSVLSKRLIRERRKSFWQSGALRNGNVKQRLAWVMQRLNETSHLRLINPYMKGEL